MYDIAGMKRCAHGRRASEQEVAAAICVCVCVSVEGVR